MLFSHFFKGGKKIPKVAQNVVRSLKKQVVKKTNRWVGLYLFAFAEMYDDLVKRIRQTYGYLTKEGISQEYKWYFV